MPPEAGSFQEKPKRLRYDAWLSLSLSLLRGGNKQLLHNRFVMDCSGSMYRFNGQDKRLDRLLEATCMIMESLSGHEAKYSYSIVAHSGGKPRPQRLVVECAAADMTR
jgi:hypothetical protein